MNVKEVFVTYQIDASRSAWICESVSDYENRLLTNELICSVVKTAFSELSAQEAISLSKTEALVLLRLSESLAMKYGADIVYVRKVLISGMEFEELYRAKSAALQEQVRGEITNQTALASRDGSGENANIGES